MRSATHIADLQEQRTAQALLNIQIVVVAVGRTEVLAHGEDVENLSATVPRRAGRVRRNEDWHAGLDRVAVPRKRLHRRRSRRISFKTIGSAVAWSIVQERIQVR